MQLVVPSAVRAAVAAAMKMRRITSHTEFFFIASDFRLILVFWFFEEGVRRNVLDIRILVFDLMVKS